jgi:hypothetical protein
VRGHRKAASSGAAIDARGESIESTRVVCAGQTRTSDPAMSRRRKRRHRLSELAKQKGTHRSVLKLRLRTRNEDAWLIRTFRVARAAGSLPAYDAYEPPSSRDA